MDSIYLTNHPSIQKNKNWKSPKITRTHNIKCFKMRPKQDYMFHVVVRII